MLKNEREDELMLTETHVRTAVANGTHFINRTREPYALLFLDLMHRRFGVQPFADALKRFDEVLAERPNEAPLLRVLRRPCCACCGASPMPTTRCSPRTGTTCRSKRIAFSSRRCIAIGWAYRRRSPKCSGKP
jgi:hypothetical protein